MLLKQQIHMQIYVKGHPIYLKSCMLYINITVSLPGIYWFPLLLLQHGNQLAQTLKLA